MAIFNSFVKLPEGIWWIFWIDPPISCWPRFLMFFAGPFLWILRQARMLRAYHGVPALGPYPHALTVHLFGGSTVTPRGCAGEIPKNRWSQKWSPSIEFLYRKCRWHRQVPTNWPRRKCPEVGMGCRDPSSENWRWVQLSWDITNQVLNSRVRKKMAARLTKDHT
jgi:hypothetical protein